MRALNEYDAKLLLKKRGIPVIEEYQAAGIREALKAAENIGYPVVLKVCSAEVLHKSDRGGVILNVQTAPALQEAADRIKASFSEPHTLLVQKMAPAGAELIIGAKRDPVFGPTVLAGMGGILAEVFKDAAVELAPVELGAARKMLDRLRGASILHGCRGRAPLDIDAAARAIVALSRLIFEQEDISEIDINPLLLYPSGALAVDALVCHGDVKPPALEPRPAPSSLDGFFNPRSVAVIGASSLPGKGGHIILKNFIRAGYSGKLYPVNPSAEDILGLKTYKTVLDIPEAVDMAMIVIPKAGVDGAIDRCIQKGVQNIILSTGGYSDIGGEGTLDQQKLVEKTGSAGIRLMGPNSIGTINPRSGVATSIVSLDPIGRGGVSLFGQSGVFSSGWARWVGDHHPFGVAKIACIGNKGDVNETDILEYLTGDQETTTIGMYLEGVSEGTRFVDVAGKACIQKPVVVLKSGRTESGAQAIASHTGSLAGSDAVFDAVCRKTGMIRAYDSEAFFDALAAFEMLPLPKGNRMGALSITGLGCVLTTDAAEEFDIGLSRLQSSTQQRIREVMPDWAPLRNPVDIWSAVEQHGSAKTMSHIARCLLEQDDIDSVLIIFVVMPESIFDIEAAFGPLVKDFPDKPVFVSYFGGGAQEINHIRRGFSNIGVPCYPTPERALRAFRAMTGYARFKDEYYLRAR
ncbi:MAG: acetate--CoA ligase family protein [Desulfobacterales bacterium]|nr:acetate--CoA ligase family protein [Desulfobacterales bacterium]